MINRKFLHLFFKVLTSIPFLNIEISIPRFLRKTFHSFPLIFLFLNQLSPTTGNMITSAMKDFVKTNFTTPISTLISSYALAKDFVTYFSCPSNLSMNSSHHVCCNNCLTYGYLSRNLTPFNFDLIMNPMLEKISP